MNYLDLLGNYSREFFPPTGTDLGMQYPILNEDIEFSATITSDGPDDILHGLRRIMKRYGFLIRAHKLTDSEIFDLYCIGNEKPRIRKHTTPDGKIYSVRILAELLTNPSLMTGSLGSRLLGLFHFYPRSFVCARSEEIPGMIDLIRHFLGTAMRLRPENTIEVRKKRHLWCANTDPYTDDSGYTSIAPHLCYDEVTIQGSKGISRLHNLEIEIGTIRDGLGALLLSLLLREYFGTNLIPQHNSKIERYLNGT
jgi:hypothetical protein